MFNQDQIQKFKEASSRIDHNVDEFSNKKDLHNNDGFSTKKDLNDMPAFHDRDL